MLLAPRLEILLTYLYTRDNIIGTALGDRVYRASIAQEEREYPALTFSIANAVAVESVPNQLDLLVTVQVIGEGTEAEDLIEPGDRADYLIRTLDGEVGGVRFSFLRKEAEIDLVEDAAGGLSFSHVGGQYTIRAEEPMPLVPS